MKFILAVITCLTYCSHVFTENNTETSTFLLCETAKRTYKNAGYEEDDIYTIEQNGNEHSFLFFLFLFLYDHFGFVCLSMLLLKCYLLSRKDKIIYSVIAALTFAVH